MTLLFAERIVTKKLRRIIGTCRNMDHARIRYASTADFHKEMHL
jgi:hypothetical protein